MLAGRAPSWLHGERTNRDITDSIVALASALQRSKIGEALAVLSRNVEADSQYSFNFLLSQKCDFRSHFCVIIIPRLFSCPGPRPSDIPSRSPSSPRLFPGPSHPRPVHPGGEESDAGIGPLAHVGGDAQSGEGIVVTTQLPPIGGPPAAAR